MAASLLKPAPGSQCPLCEISVPGTQRPLLRSTPSLVVVYMKEAVCACVVTACPWCGRRMPVHTSAECKEWGPSPAHLLGDPASSLMRVLPTPCPAHTMRPRVLAGALRAHPPVAVEEPRSGRAVLVCFSTGLHSGWLHPPNNTRMNIFFHKCAHLCT